MKNILMIGAHYDHISQLIKLEIVNFLKSIINTTEESKIRLHMRWI